MMPVAYQKLPYAFVRQHGVCVQMNDKETLIAYHKKPLSPFLLVEMRRFLMCTFRLEQVSYAVFEQIVEQVYQHSTGDVQQFAQDANQILSLEHALQYAMTSIDLLAEQNDAPIIRLINAIFMEALQQKASDIHIEPFEKLLKIRFRIDGILQENLVLENALTPFMISRIKIMAGLDIAEKRLPQDGRISLTIGERDIDVRVATIPTGNNAGNNERIVLRLLDKRQGKITLAVLGMDEASYQAVLTLLQKPHGIILVTGATGSGKTTSLYAMLGYLNDETRNIMTIEDPVEYQMMGISQTQVNPKIEMDFARGLRAILRQDPDIVMIGEIRDQETASIAVQASITGHLVLATLHTNTAIGAISRLCDMGLQRFLLASSIAGLIAQRLVRVLCPACRDTHQATAEELAFLHLANTTTPIMLYHAVGCNDCHHTGYRGRTAIYEVVVVDKKIAEYIHEGASESVIAAYAHANIPSIHHNGCRKILAGETTIAEIMRVVN